MFDKLRTFTGRKLIPLLVVGNDNSTLQSTKEKEMSAQSPMIKRKVLKYGVGALLLLGLSVSPILAADVTAPTPIDETAKATLLAGGPRSQAGPQVSGNLVTYTDYGQDPVAGGNTGIIHYEDLVAGVDHEIPGQAGVVDANSDISGRTIVFTREPDMVAGPHRIMFTTIGIDGLAGAVQELAPLSDSTASPQRHRPAVGGNTVAFEEIKDINDPVGTSEISVASLSAPSAPAVRLTNDAFFDGQADVSPDGNVVVWTKDMITGTAIYQATRDAGGNWVTTQLTTSGTYASAAHTDGKIVTYVAFTGQQVSDGYPDYDVYWQPVGGGAENRLVMPAGVEINSTVSGGVISFISNPGKYHTALIYVYDTNSGKLYQLTGEMTVHNNRDIEISLQPDGSVRVVWTQWGADLEDLYQASFQVGPLYTTQPLFDQSHSYKLGGVAPLRFQLFDAQGKNISSASLLPTVAGLVQKDTASSSVVETPGNSNPDTAIRYDSTLQGYIFNLSTKNLSVGTWDMQFKVPGDQALYHVLFDLR